MTKAWRIFKAIFYAVLFMLVCGSVLVLLVWTKGLVALLLIFAIIAYGIYQQLERKDYDRNWRERNRAWRNYE